MGLVRSLTSLYLGLFRGERVRETVIDDLDLHRDRIVP